MDWLALIQAVMPVLVTALAGSIVRQIAVYYWSQPAQQRELIDAVVRSAVFAAEQLGRTQVVRDKRTYALEYAQAVLARYGINVSATELAGLVEAAVYEYFNRWPPTPTSNMLSAN